MRKYLVNLVFVTTLTIITLFLGCKDENTIVETPPGPDYELLTGEWKFSTLTYSDSDSSVTHTAEELKITLSFIFRDDNTASIIQYSLDERNTTNCSWWATTSEIYLIFDNSEEENFKYRCEEDILSLQLPFRNANGQSIEAWFNFEKVSALD